MKKLILTALLLIFVSFAFADLADFFEMVNITSLASGDLIQWDGTDWVNITTPSIAVGTITGANGETIDNATNDYWKITAQNLALVGEATALYLDYGSAGAENHDISIFFGDDGTNDAHEIRFDDGNNRFQFDSDVYVDGGIIQSSDLTAAGNANYFLATNTVASGEFNAFQARGRATAVGVSTAETRGVYARATTNASLFGGYVTALQTETIAKDQSTTKELRGAFIAVDSEGTPTAIEDIYGAYIRTKTSVAPSGDFYPLVIENETFVGGVTADAGILLKGTATGGFGYGIDMNGATMSTGDWRLRNGALFNNSTADLLTITEATVAITSKTVYTPNAASNAGTSVADDGAITVTNRIMRMVGADADAVLDTDPAINDGTADGEIVIIQGTADGNLVTIVDNVNTQLDGAVTVALGDGDVICLMWDSNYSMWIEQYRSDN